MRSVNISELQTLLTNEPRSVRLLDVREPQEYTSGHIQEAELLPYSLLAVLADERLTNKEESLVIYCEHGGRAAAAAAELVSMGYTEVSVVDGGYAAWAAMEASQVEPVLSAGGLAIRLGADGVRYMALEQQVGVSRDTDIWFIPKGHVEPGETVEAAAAREVEEEAGASDLKMIQKVCVKERIGTRCGKRKQVHFYLFETDNETLHPTATDKPHRGAWFPLYGDVQIGFAVQQEALEMVREMYKNK